MNIKQESKKFNRNGGPSQRRTVATANCQARKDLGLDPVIFLKKLLK